MKKVYLYAYDKQNLGDDLFVHTITKRYPKAKFYMITDAKNKIAFKELKNLRVIDKESLISRILERIRPSFNSRYQGYYEKRCDATVFIGGSIFIEYETWKQSLTWWNYEAENRNFYVLGANFGPYKTEDYKNQMGEIFCKMKDVCFRDIYSYNLFSNIPTVRYAPDILFGIDMPKREKKQKQVFVSVINCAEKEEGENYLSNYEDNYFSAMLLMVKRFINDGFRVLFSSFCQIEGDEKEIKKILENLNEFEKDSIDILNYNGCNSQRILQEITNSDLIIASRFHALILGICANKPVFPFVYSDKTLNVLKDIRFNGKWCDLRTLDVSSFAELFKIEKIIEMNNCSTIFENYLKHFYRLDELLLM